MKLSSCFLFATFILFASVALAQDEVTDGISRRNSLLGDLQTQKDTLAPDSVIISTLNRILIEDQALIETTNQGAIQIQKKDSLIAELRSENEGLSTFVGSWAKSAVMLYSVVAGVLLLLVVLVALLYLAKRKNRQMATEFHSQFLKIEGTNKHLNEEIRKVENAFVEKSNQTKLLQNEIVQMQLEFESISNELKEKENDLTHLSLNLDDRSQQLQASEEKISDLSLGLEAVKQQRIELENQHRELAGKYKLLLESFEQAKIQANNAGDSEQFHAELQQAGERIILLEKELKDRNYEYSELENKLSRGMAEESRRKLDNLEINLLKLEKLHRLLEIQALTQQEYDSMKAQILPELVSLPTQE